MAAKLQLAEVIFIACAIGSLVPWAVAFFIQQWRLPVEMRGFRLHAFQALAMAFRDTSHQSHREARIYLVSVTIFVALLASAFVTFPFIGIGSGA